MPPSALKLHIAGYPVEVGNQIRQRCAWCGEILLALDQSRAIASPDGTPARPPEVWTMGAVVAMDGGRAWLHPHEEGATLPPESCAHPASAGTPAIVLQ